MKKLGAIILAAGKGTRMNSKKLNKVVLPLAKKPMILHEIEFLSYFNIDPIVVVVGFARKSVEEVLKGVKVIYAMQRKRLGTAHAVATALLALPKDVENVLVIQGDDSLFYRKQNERFVQDMIDRHISSNASMTFLTIEMENPFGLGRVVRNEKNEVVGIVEEKDATDAQRQIKEINPACYIFKTTFLKKYLKKIKKSAATKEYYLVSLVNLAYQHHERIETIRIKKAPWRGINTPAELTEAELLFSQG